MSPVISGGSSGYTPPTGNCVYSGNTVSIANGATGNITWDTLALGTALLNITTVAAPQPLVSGIYCISGYIIPAAMTAAGTYQVQLEMAQTGNDLTTVMRSSPASAAVTTPRVAFCQVAYVLSTDTIQIKVTNNDGSSTVLFHLGQGNVQRIT